MDLIIQEGRIRDETASYAWLWASELDSPCEGGDVTIKVSRPTSAGKGNWHEVKKQGRKKKKVK